MEILTTKLYIPSVRQKVVRRPRLITRLNEGLHCKLTLISAPAGFGKTTLVSNWFTTFEYPVAWLSLDEADSDLTRFFSYIVASLQTIFPELGSTISTQLHSPQPPIESILTALLNEIATIANKFLLVLDDYHMIDSEPIDNALAFLLTHLPPQMHLVITTREDPNLPLARLRVRNQLTELRVVDLRFTLAEVAEFLNQTMNLTLSSKDIAALETRTEGWIAGLQLAAISMQTKIDKAVFIKSFAGSNHFILDYLVEEVLQSQPEYIRSFLLQTSILDRLSDSLCDAVVAQQNSKSILKTLKNGNLFIVPLDDQRHWYRYHHLFADFLQAYLGNEQPDLLPTLHQRASQWYELNGLTTEAIYHALEAKDFEQAASLIELAWPTMDGSFQTGTWLEWANSLPASIVHIRPVLNVAYAWAYLNRGDLEMAETCLQDAEQCLDITTDISQKVVFVDEEQFRSLPASIASARTYHAQAIGDMPNTIKYARQALDLLPKDAYIKRGPAASLLGLMYWANGELELAYQALADAMNGFRMAGQIQFAISGTYGLADMRIAQGRLREAIKIYEQALPLALAQGKPAIRGLTDIYWGLAMLAYEQSDMETYHKHLLKSEDLGEQAALPDWPYRRALALACIQEAEGSFDEAFDLLNEAEQLYVRSPVPLVRPIPALKAQIWIKQGEFTKANHWVREQGLSVDNDLRYLREFEHMTLVRLLVAAYGHDQTNHSIDGAMGLLERLLQAAEDDNRVGSVLEILLLQVLVYEVQGNIPLACVLLKRALTLAEPEGYVRLFVNEGLVVAGLMPAISTQAFIPAYINKLIAAFEAEGHKIAEQTSPISDPQPLVDPLSDRELEILTGISNGLKNKEIAAQLFVSINTVHYHTKNIYGKLGVNNRTKAVAKAKILNLL